MDVQQQEEKIQKAVMLQESNTEVLESLKAFYSNVVENTGFPTKDENKDDISQFKEQLQEMINDSKLQISRAKLLLQIASNRKSLVGPHGSHTHVHKLKTRLGCSTSSKSGGSSYGGIHGKHI